MVNYGTQNVTDLQTLNSTLKAPLQVLFNWLFHQCDSSSYHVWKLKTLLSLIRQLLGHTVWQWIIMNSEIV